MENNCQVCKTNEKSNIAKYKCPTCLIKYCSLDCWKIHKESKCIASTENSVTFELDTKGFAHSNLFPTDDTIPTEVLEKLKDDGDLRALLQNPSLRQLLSDLDQSKRVKADMQKAMQEPLFVEFADACLAVVEPGMGDSAT